MGTVFEPICERLVKIDYETACMGGKISIQAGNVGYSPDRYCVVSSTQCGKN